MSTFVQFFIDNEATHQPFEGPVPAKGDEVELDGKRYRVQQVVLSYWTENMKVTANVYLRAVGGSIIYA